MAPIGRAGLLQLLCGTRKPRQSRGVPTAVAGTVVAQDASPEPAASVLVEPHARVRGSLASATASAPSLPRSSLRRQSSAIRTGCANERPSGSVRGVSREWYPYRDLIDLLAAISPSSSGRTSVQVVFRAASTFCMSIFLREGIARQF